MEARLQRRIQRYGWDAAAGVYGEAWAEQLRPAHDMLLEMIGLEPGMRVLEPACGTGLLTLRVAQAVGPEGAVFATDISGEMVAATAADAADRGLLNVETARCDAEDLPVDDDTFDAALCALGLMYVVEPVMALAEMRRAVCPGGKVAATVWGERKNCAWAEIFPIVDAEVNSEVCPLFFSLGAPQSLVNAMSEAGLKDIEQHRQIVELCFADAGSLLYAKIDGGAVALAAKRFTPEARTRVEQAFLDSVADYRLGDGSYAIPGEIVTALGRA